MMLCEGRTVGIHPVLALDRLPVIRFDKDPRPAAETAGAVLVQQQSQDGHLLMALLRRISGVAREMLRRWFRNVLFCGVREGDGLRC